MKLYEEIMRRLPTDSADGITAGQLTRMLNSDGIMVCENNVATRLPEMRRMGYPIDSRRVKSENNRTSYKVWWKIEPRRAIQLELRLPSGAAGTLPEAPRSSAAPVP